MDDLLTNIERYLQQQQLLAGDILYTLPVSVNNEAYHDSSHLDTAHINSSKHHTMPKKKDIVSPNHRVESFVEPSAESLFADSLFPLPSKQQKTTPQQHKKNTVAATWKTAPTLDALYNDIHLCMNCKLGATRTKFVFGVGNPNADILVIGEAPGADEDAQGEPFVGRAGQLLTKILEAVNLKREDVFIANIIKCRPPGNRRPEADEVAECEPYLYKQIDLLQPKFILALGLTAVDTLLKKKHTMAAIRGKELQFRGIPMIATYHPAALLRNPEWKRATWEDVQYLRRLYDAQQETKGWQGA